MLTLQGIAAIIDSITRLTEVVVKSQTPEQQKIMWDRYIEITGPFHRLAVKILEAGDDNG